MIFVRKAKAISYLRGMSNVTQRLYISPTDIHAQKGPFCNIVHYHYHMDI